MSFIAQLSLLRAVGISASPGGDASRSRRLLTSALARLRDVGIPAHVVDLATLPAEGLLGRRREPAVERAIESLDSAHLVLVATPVYRASYAGLLKVFFDLLPEEALVGKVAVPIATGGGPGHLLAIDHGLRPLLGSLGATVVPGGVYGTPSGFTDGEPDTALLERVNRAVVEAVSLAAATVSRLTPHPLERQLRHAHLS